jgi:hypothetical protein
VKYHQHTHANSDSASEEICKLLSVELPFRNEVWHNEFFSLVAIAKFYVPKHPIMIGSDELPYFSLFVREYMGLDIASHKARLVDIIEEITNTGLGIVIEPFQPKPYSFTYGGAWGFREDNTFLLENCNASSTNKQSVSMPVIIDRPSEVILPNYARQIIKSFMQDALNISKPAVFLETVLDRESPYTLVFNIIDGIKSDEEVMSCIELLSWFIRPGYYLSACDNSTENQNILMEL